MGHLSESERAMASSAFGNVTADEILCTNGTDVTVCWTKSECLIAPNDGGEPELFERPDFVDGFAVASIVLACISLLVSAAAIVFVVRNKAKPVIRMSQYEFMILLAGGYFLFNFSVLLQVIGYIGYFPGICRAYFAFFFVSAFCIFVVLALKTYRAYRLLKSTETLQRVTISNTLLYKWLAGVELLVVVVLIAWFVAFPLQVNPCEDVGPECAAAASFFGGGGNAFNTALSVLLIFVLFITLAVAFMARRVPSIAGESVGIFISVVLFWFGVFVVVTLIYGLSDLAVTAKSFAIALWFLISTSVSLYMLVLYKSRFFHMKSDDVRNTFLTAASSTPVKVRARVDKPAAEQETSTQASSTYASSAYVSSTAFESTAEAKAGATSHMAVV